LLTYKKIGTGTAGFSSRSERSRHWQHRTLAVVVSLIVDRHQAQPFAIGRIVGVAEEAERERVSAHALDEHVVVLAGGEVPAARMLVPDDREL
jgi:hypothetical protein